MLMNFPRNKNSIFNEHPSLFFTRSLDNLAISVEFAIVEQKKSSARDSAGPFGLQALCKPSARTRIPTCDVRVVETLIGVSFAGALSYEIEISAII